MSAQSFAFHSFVSAAPIASVPFPNSSHELFGVWFLWHLMFPHEYATYASLITSRGFLSSRNPTNFECLSRSASVHSRNSILATASGRSQTHSFIFSAVSSSPQRDLCVSGRLTKGIVGE